MADALDLLTGGLASASGLSLTTRGLLVEAEEEESAAAVAGLSARRMTDVAMELDRESLSGDVQVDGGRLIAEHGLRTAVLVSLFTDRLAEPDDVLPLGEESRRGWWADLVPPAPEDRIGSRLWLLARERQTQETRLRARQYTEEALAWLVEDEVAAEVEVAAEWVRRGVLGLGITIHRPEQPDARFRFAVAWEGV